MESSYKFILFLLKQNSKHTVSIEPMGMVLVLWSLLWAKRLCLGFKFLILDSFFIRCLDWLVLLRSLKYFSTTSGHYLCQKEMFPVLEALLNHLAKGSEEYPILFFKVYLLTDLFILINYIYMSLFTKSSQSCVLLVYFRYTNVRHTLVRLSLWLYGSSLLFHIYYCI